MLTTFNSTSYFIYRGAQMGFEYELLKSFARLHRVKIKFNVVDDLAEIFDKLNLGEGDIVASRLIPTKYDTANVYFTDSLYTTKPVVVQKELGNNENILPQPVDTILEIKGYKERPDAFTIDAQLIRKPKDLIGEVVHIPAKSPYEDNLIEIENEQTGEIEIIKVKGKVSYETLIREVSRGDIELTVSQENLARLKKSYFSNLVIKPTIGSNQKVAFAVRKTSPQLRDKLDEWINSKRGQKIIARLYDKYFIDRKGYKERIGSDYLTSETGKLSKYDDLLIKYSSVARMDWRLFAAQAFQESRFNPRAKSWAGAVGLMQLMYKTARSLGVRDRYNPEENVRGAADYLSWLFDFWENKGISDKDKLAFVLASYNGGVGHVGDARRLAKKYGDDPDSWNDVSFWLLQKSKKKYYRDPVVKYGYVRGIEPVTYVKMIMDRYKNYVKFIEPIKDNLKS